MEDWIGVKAEATTDNMGVCARVFAADYRNINRPVKSGKDHIFTFAGLLKNEWFIGNDDGLVNLGKGKNVANTRTLCGIYFASLV
jgi:hypothetical protein